MVAEIKRVVKSKHLELEQPNKFACAKYRSALRQMIEMQSGKEAGTNLVNLNQGNLAQFEFLVRSLRRRTIQQRGAAFGLAAFVTDGRTRRSQQLPERLTKYNPRNGSELRREGYLRTLESIPRGRVREWCSGLCRGALRIFSKKKTVLVLKFIYRKRHLEYQQTLGSSLCFLGDLVFTT